MFVSIIIDPGSIDSARAVMGLLNNTGFRQIQRSCWENPKITENDLAGLKKDIDRVTDYYDVVRIYQFPLNGMFVITELKEKKWRRCQLSAAAPKTKPGAKKPSAKN
ncbi:MAG TPA: CRISPR-associated protein Cas2 [Treponema sp.]|jgi:CRISPR-associated protein Cas2|nr:CRISPR-associated protein Cas2 [Treponema sp.]HBB42681.1 CRISPR-associated protein Cas2 [Treponema sp.]HCA19143.1 CRISPR-associated protein Cas2 [Treponema sp.]